MVNLDVEKMVFSIKIIDVNTKVFAKKTIMALVFEIDSNNILTAMILINQNIIVLT